MKKYIAKTNVSINIVLPSGVNRHIAFSALTGGGSVFYTDDPEIIQAIERHYKFGKLFRVDTTSVPEKPRRKPAPMPTPAPAPTPAVEELADTPEASTAEAAPESEQPAAEEAVEADDQTDDEEVADNDFKTIVVSDPDTAKAYLAEHFGISRTKIKSIKAIKEAGAAHGIVFEGI